MKILLLATLLVSPVSFAIDSGTSPVKITDYKCKKLKNIIQGSIATGNDLGGANYKLTFEGESHYTQVMCDVLNVVKKNGQYISLRTRDTKQVPNSNTYTGTLIGVLINIDTKNPE